MQTQVKTQNLYVRKCTFRARGLVITAQELENVKEEAEEVENNIRAKFARFGHLQSLAIVRQENDEENGVLCGDVIVTFCDEKDAASAFSWCNGVFVGEKMVTCVWEELQSDNENEEKASVTVCGMLTLEELQDPDEFAAVEEEMMQVFSNHGKVKEMHIGETTGDITLTIIDEQVAPIVVQRMDGSRYGGRLLTANLTLQNGAGVETNVKGVNDLPIVKTKRVVAPVVPSREVQDLVSALLKRLAALQDRAHTQNPRHDKRSRRLVLGMHEVRRGLLRGKIILLVMATDPDGCQAVEEKHAELVTIATEQEVSVLAPMNRR
ncbi:unnamed protein product [Peronospora belbahrii]|uniref:RRM domain-containing protein n=1 Tax=Peronospora belbahrii TaxID=622444 RepID=A0AAU9L6M0_9STRA|nr:unnamed protein product [Peronospora belbahrii]CAH0519239.1 unnamed protein product [Peronospora belbahrii]